MRRRENCRARPDEAVAAEPDSPLTAHLIAAQCFRGSSFSFVSRSSSDDISISIPSPTPLLLSPLWFCSNSFISPLHCTGPNPVPVPTGPENIRIFSAEVSPVPVVPVPRPPGPAHVYMFLAPRCRAIATSRPCRICFPEPVAHQLIPRPCLSRPFRSSRHLTTHPLPRWFRPTSFKPTTTPFAPTRLRTGCRCFSHFSTVFSGHPVKMGSVLPFERKHKVTVVGSGNW